LDLLERKDVGECSGSDKTTIETSYKRVSERDTGLAICRQFKDGPAVLSEENV
jgi:hypothetical protein